MNETAPGQGRMRALGRAGPTVSALGVGTNKWAVGKNDESVFETYRAFQDGGINFFDTAEIYGFGKSERLLGECIRRDGRPAFVATKFAPVPFRSAPRNLFRALDGSLARLGTGAIDLYYLHFPIGDVVALADAMAEAVKQGKVRHVGVSNFGADRMRRFADRLGQAGIPLSANEVHFSLAARKPESNGVLAACREIGASLVAYFPLAMGRLARPADAGKATPLQQAVAEIAGAHQASPSQVALNWLLARDACVIPIPGASRPQNAQQNIAALGWSLTQAEVVRLDEAPSRR
jgi:aryl-alcohol dehydrogenase-like predicted oxidoreductase